METLHFSTIINAQREHVYNTMLDDATYREWTSVFSPGGSFYEGTWEEGSTIRFIGIDPEKPENRSGMICQVEVNTPHEFVSLLCLGQIIDGVDDTTSEKIQAWAGSHENYTFTEVDGGTEVVVDIDVAPEFVESFSDMWPKGLAKLKEISER